MAKAKLNVDEMLGDIEKGPQKSDTKRSKRPRSGEVREGEPAEREIFQAAMNLPREEFPVNIAGYNTKLVDLNFLQSRAYLNALLPAVEKAVKDMVPLINSVQASWFFLKNFNSDNTEELREAVLYGGIENDALRQTLENWGLQGVTEGSVGQLKEAAENSVRFSNHLSWLFMAPLIDALRQIDLSKIILEAVDLLPGLATASVMAALEAEGKAGLEHEPLKAHLMQKADAFDMLDVAVKQIALYRKGGKLGNFTKPIIDLIGLATN